MLSPWIIVFCSLIYIGILFTIAYHGDQRTHAPKLKKYRAYIYSLSLAIYCTSWTFYGAVGSAATNGWQFIAIYLGPIITVVLGYHFLRRVALICSEQNITSIADFIASRYGKSQRLAVLVTLIAITGTLPYIALQLKAVASSYEVLSSGEMIRNSTAEIVTTPILPGTESVDTASNGAVVATAIAETMHHPAENTSFLNDTGFIVALVMAVFCILFGTRYVHASEHHEGLILAIAFESIVKLFALTLVAVFALFIIIDPPTAVFKQMSDAATSSPLLAHSIGEDVVQLTFLAHMVLAMAAIFSLPRQFHVTFVEVTHADDMSKARWLFPVYLLLTTLVVIPITLAGSQVFHAEVANGSVNPDMFVLTLPLKFENDLLAMLAFIGGFSAATGMVIVAVIALSTMVCNDIVMPILFRFQFFKLKQQKDLTQLLLMIRRIAILGILMLSYFYYQYINENKALASIGLIAFVAAIQFAPALIGAVYWKRATRRGATAGLLAGFAIWLYTLFVPALISDQGYQQNLFSDDGFLSFLKPDQLFGVAGLDPITHSLIFSLGANIIFYVLFSLQRKPELVERIQSANFTHTANIDHLGQGLPWWSTVAVGELRLLAEKFVGEAATEKAFADYTRNKSSELIASEKADTELINFTERLLSGAIGASSARVMINSVLSNKKDLPLEDVFSIVDETSQALQFNQALLNATIEHLDQGISVIDEDSKLVAWNSRYIEIYNYPKDLIKVGRPVADLIRHNAKLGECGPGDVEEHVRKRLDYMKEGTVHSYQRHRSDGTVIYIQGRPLPGGGFVTTFTDITEHKKIERELRETNENLEQRVEARTVELSQVNDELQQVNRSKTRFMAAVNHDVMQPLNAARLFTSALAESIDDSDKLTDRINSSLRSAEEIIHTLIDISKLDSGAVRANTTVFNINRLMNNLHKEFSVIAENKSIDFRYVPCHVRIESDAHLLRRILQNLISNALRYTPKNGRVTIGCRRKTDSQGNKRLEISVLDTGVGMNASDLTVVFEEFRQLDNQLSEETKGVGLGLSIAKRLGQILNHPIHIQSKLGTGSHFSLVVPVSDKAVEETVTEVQSSPRPGVTLPIAGLKVLCVDNDPDILDGMSMLLKRWSCEPHCAKSLDSALFDISQQQYRPDIMLVDYHLNNQEKGLEVMDKIRQVLKYPIEGILITADVGEELQIAARESKYRYIAKPVKPVLLRKMLTKLALKRADESLQ